MKIDIHIKKYLYKLTIFIFLIFLFFVSCVRSTPSHLLLSQTDEVKPISLVFVGDAMHHMPQYYAAYDYKTQKPDFSPSFRYIKPWIESADFAVCNLETPLAGRPYSGYPQFSAPDEYLDALKDTGFDLFQLANNHILDRGKWGLEQTIQKIKNNNLASIGAYIDIEQKDSVYPYTTTIKGVKIAFLNYTYGTNGIRTSQPNIVNTLDTVQINKDFIKIENDKPDIVVALIHWGEEYRLKSNKNQKNWVDYFIRKGTDLIIGTHPHVVQEVELRNHNNKLIPVFYSLGNFISNQREPHTNGGILANIEIDPKFKIISKIKYLPFYVHKGEIHHVFQYYIVPINEYNNKKFDYSLSRYDSLQMNNFNNSVVSRIQNIQILK